MKNKLGIIFKNTIFDSLKIKKLTLKKKILYLFLIIFIFISLFSSLSLFFNEIFVNLQKTNLTDYFLPIIFSLATFFAFLFTIYSAKASLFENKDNDLLCSLPIKKSTILTSRFLYLTLFNFIIGVIFLLPGIYIYVSNISVNIEFYLIIVVALLFFAIIPTIIASLFGFVIAFILSKTKHKNIFELLFYFLFIACYLILMLNSSKLINIFINNLEIFKGILKYGFFSILLLSKGIIENNIIYIIYYVIFNLVVLGLFIFIFNRLYFYLLSAIKSINNKHNYKLHYLKKSSIKKALIKKELNQYFRSPIYVLNTIIGPLILFGLGIASFFYSIFDLSKIIIDKTMAEPVIFVFGILLFTISLSNITCSSISMEKNSFWILKSLPVKINLIFRSKTFVNKIMVLPCTYIALILFYINKYVNLEQFILLVVFSTFLTLFISNMGLLINLKFPKLDALNDTVIVKKSTSVFISTVIPIFITIGLLGLLFTLKSVNFGQMLLIAIAIIVFLYTLSIVLLNTFGKKQFVSLG